MRVDQLKRRTYNMGDRVRVAPYSAYYRRYMEQSEGTAGTIVNLYAAGREFDIKWDNGHTNTYSSSSVMLEHESFKKYDIKINVIGGFLEEFAVYAESEEDAREEAEFFVIQNGFSTDKIVIKENWLVIGA